MIGVKWKCIEKLWTFTTPKQDQLGQEEIYWGANGYCISEEPYGVFLSQISGTENCYQYKFYGTVNRGEKFVSVNNW